MNTRFTDFLLIITELPHAATLHLVGVCGKKLPSPSENVAEHELISFSQSS